VALHGFQRFGEIEGDFEGKPLRFFFKLTHFYFKFNSSLISLIHLSSMADKEVHYQDGDVQIHNEWREGSEFKSVGGVLGDIANNESGPSRRGSSHARGFNQEFFQLGIFQSVGTRSQLHGTPGTNSPLHLGGSHDITGPQGGSASNRGHIGSHLRGRHGSRG